MCGDYLDSSKRELSLSVWNSIENSILIWKMGKLELLETIEHKPLPYGKFEIKLSKFGLLLNGTQSSQMCAKLQ